MTRAPAVHLGPAAKPADAAAHDLGVAAVNAAGQVVSTALWPLACLILFVCLRRRLEALFDSFVARVGDHKTSVTLGGLSLAAAQQGELDTLQATLAQLRVLIDQSTAPGAPPNAPTDATAWAQLDSLARDYDAVADPDWAERARQKDQLGRQMAALVYDQHLPRAPLFARQQDPYIVAAAYTVLIDPQPTDVDLLCQAAQHVQRNHARHALATALGRVAGARLIGAHQRRLVLDTLTALERRDDPSLMRRLRKTRAVVELKEDSGSP